MTLDGLERALKDAFPPTTRKGQQAKVHVVRYADDFIVSGAVTRDPGTNGEAAGRKVHAGARSSTFGGKDQHHAY